MKKEKAHLNSKPILSKTLEQTLITAALAARENAHCPYSNYKVGAALLAANGEIYTGCNVENASYGLTNCAERTAVFSAVADGERDFAALCVAAKFSNPCGACRQVMSEFMLPQTPVILVNINGTKQEILHTTVGELLPLAFDSKTAGL